MSNKLSQLPPVRLETDKYEQLLFICSKKDIKLSQAVRNALDVYINENYSIIKIKRWFFEDNK